MCRSGLHNFLSRVRIVLVIAGGVSRPPGFFWGKTSNTRRIRVTAPADLEPPNGFGARVGVWVRSGVGLVWADLQG